MILAWPTLPASQDNDSSKDFRVTMSDSPSNLNGAADQVKRWGKDFFDVDEQGRIVVRHQDVDSAATALQDLVDELADQRIECPIIFKFPGIIRERVCQLYRAFEKAIQQFDYAESYQCVYPIKVNQSRPAVETILAHDRYEVGLEAGSKAELLTILAVAKPNTTILYNGFKDRTSIEMAIRASRLGRDITIIIEKPNEIELIQALSQELGHCPRLGIRVKLASRGSGHWEHSGGLRSKFGLFVPQLLAAVERLRELGLLKHFQLLHFHPGSQINDVLRIKASVIEATRIYCDLVQRGAPLNRMDVGGGLAVDYTGQQSTDSSSMNYSLQEYANDIVYYIKRVCDQVGVSPPRILSESGRALVAHHAVMVFSIIGSSYRDIESYETDVKFDRSDRSLQPLVELQDTLQDVSEKNLLESFHDAQQAIDMTLQLFANGMMSLENRSVGESLFWQVCRKIRLKMNSLKFVPGELDSLRDLFAETYIANFSVFQSLRDHWAIDQLFPIVPLVGLDRGRDVDAVLGDITCDSDGKVERFVCDKASRRTLKVHALRQDEPYYMGAFLVGAYQQSLGESHNLLGRPHTVCVEFENGKPVLTRVSPGDSIEEIMKWNSSESEHGEAEASLLDEFVASLNSEEALFFANAAREYCYLSIRPPEHSPVGDTLQGQKATSSSREVEASAPQPHVSLSNSPAPALDEFSQSIKKS